MRPISWTAARRHCAARPHACDHASMRGMQPPKQGLEDIPRHSQAGLRDVRKQFPFKLNELVLERREGCMAELSKEKRATRASKLLALGQGPTRVVGRLSPELELLNNFVVR